MVKPKTIRSKGKGWFNQPIRHSRARKYGKAGGIYKSNKAAKRLQTILKNNPQYYNLNLQQLKNKGIFLRYNTDTDKDGVINIEDCQPLNPKMQDLKEAIKEGEEKATKLIAIGFKKAKELGREGIKKAKEIAKETIKKIEEAQERRKQRQEKAIKKAVLQATKSRLIPEVTEKEVEEEIKKQMIKEEQTEEFSFKPVEEIFKRPEFVMTPEKAQELAERTQEALRKAKRKRIDDLKEIDMSELTDDELKEIAIRLGTGFFGKGNKFENELKRRIKERKKINTDLQIETMRAEREAQERINKELERGVKEGGYIWDDWFK